MIISKKYKFIFVSLYEQDSKFLHNYLSECIQDDSDAIILRSNKEEEFMQIVDIKKNYFNNEEEFNSYKKFAFVRDPFDIMVNYHLSRQEEYENILRRNKQAVLSDKQMAFIRGDFLTWIREYGNENIFLNNKATQCECLSDSNKIILVDSIGHCENLEEHLIEILNSIGIKKEREDIKAPKIYQDPKESLYDFTAKEIVRNKFMDDLNYLGYDHFV
tara:strand:+ start:1904 stop:2554 length:651 start_codon:yes stop_codon:yes gene_type:complete